MNFLGINIKQLFNWAYITAVPSSSFHYINYFLILTFDFFLIWVIFLALYIFKSKKDSPIYNIFRKISWSAFYLCLLLIALLFSRDYSVPHQQADRI